MAICPDGQETVLGVCPTPKALDISCLPPTDGMPGYTPSPDTLPFAFDEATGVLWFHSCPDQWVPFDLRLCRLPQVDIGVLADACASLNIPVTFDNLGVCNEGTVTLQTLSQEIATCIGFTPNTTSVIIGSTNVGVTAATIGTTTTYTIEVDPDNSVLTNLQVAGNLIATHDDGDGNISQINETITAISSDGAGGIDYVNEAGVSNNIAAGLLGRVSVVVSSNTGNVIATHNDGDGNIINISETITSLVSDGNGGLNFTDEGGTTNNITSAMLGNTSSIVSLNTGNAIAAHNDGDGIVTQIQESVTQMILDGVGGFSFTNEVGLTTPFPPPTIPAATDPSVMTSLNPSIGTNHLIARHDDGTGTLVDINETNTFFDMLPDGTFSYLPENGPTQFGQTPRGVVVWRSGAQPAIPAGVSIGAAITALVNNDPDSNFTVGAAGITINQAGRYLVGTQVGSALAANIGEICTPVIFVNGAANANLPGGGSPYPQNHTYIADQGVFGTAHLITFLNAGDLLQAGIGVTAAGTWSLNEGYVVYLGAS